MNNITGYIKIEGRAGLFHAYDATRNYIAATNAVSGKPYTCPICGCAMHVTTTRTGIRIFARNPKQPHTDPACITIERKGVEHSFCNLDPEIFIMGLCHPTPRKKSPRIDPNDKDGNEIKKVPHNESPDESSKLKSFNSLKQIAESGIDHLNPDDMQGNHKVSEFIMTYKYAGNFFTDPNFILGARIVYARYAWFDSKTKAIIFSMYGKNDFSVKFRVVFPSQKDFRNYRDKFGMYKENSTGKTVFEKHYKEQDVLIACDEWIYIDKKRCTSFCSGTKTFCKSCCGMYQAIFTNPKQIYLLPADH
ncbi:MAG: hypothetical protein ACI4EY_02560 [Lachnospiraceae bacterium]